MFDNISKRRSPAYNPESMPKNLSLKYTCPDNSPPNGKSYAFTAALVYEFPVLEQIAIPPNFSISSIYDLEHIIS